ncbi:MAG: hypothetical protein AAF939_22435, partial [Planctomycetota bacterium]
PELVSEEFGDVGPQSDLYSLGFSALELLVGPDFDSLFPDLIAFGRDPQMAWMMWHCSADRSFPPIQSQLQGVPDDLANVIEKLTSKRQQVRYSDAKEVISDLRSGGHPVGTALKKQEDADAEDAKKKKRQSRLRAAAICLVSIILCAMMLLWPKPEEPVAYQAPPSVRGVVENVLEHDGKFVLDVDGDWRDITLYQGDQVILNRKERHLRDVEKGDRAVLTWQLDDNGQEYLKVVAFRPEHFSGRITEVDEQQSNFRFRVESEEGGEGETFHLSVTDETKIVVNQENQADNVPFTIDNLEVDDQVEVDLSDDTTGMLALAIKAIRLMPLEGIIQKLQPRKGTMTIATKEGSNENLVELKLHEKCKITLNGVSAIYDQLLTPMDIEIGDRVQVMHDVKIASIEAYRPFKDQGRILSVKPDRNVFVIKSQSSTQPKTYRVDAKTQIYLGEQSVQLDELRANDTVQVGHEMPDEESPTLISLTAVRPSDRKKWAILIANQKFNSPKLPSVDTSIRNIKAIEKMITTRYGTPANQLKIFENEGRIRLEQEIPRTLNRLKSDSEILVYVATRGFCEPGKNSYLATRDFDVNEMDATGLKLDWLIDQLDACQANKKLILLDLATEIQAGDSVLTSTKQMVNEVRSLHRGGYPRFTHVFANSSTPGPTPEAMPSGPSLLGEAFAEALSGKADKEKDLNVETTELTKYLGIRVNDLAKAQNKDQITFLFTPDATPPRLSDAIQKRVLDLMSEFSDARFDPAEILGKASSIARDAGDQPEPNVVAGLILIKRGKTADALKLLEEVRLSHKSYLPAQQSVIWIHFFKRHYDTGVRKITDMLQSIPVPEKGDMLAESTLEKLEWAGRLRELAGDSPWNTRLPSADELEDCDQAIGKFGPEAIQKYEQGRLATRKVLSEFREAIDADKNAEEVLLQKRVNSFVDPIASAATMKEIQNGLND